MTDFSPNIGKFLRRLPLVLATLCGAMGQLSGPTDYQVKAAYLSNFGRFVDWSRPSSTDRQNFTICVLGEDPFGKALDTAVAGESIRRVPLVATRISRVSEAEGCRIVFVSASLAPQLGGILAALRDNGALTVSDIPQFAARGGMIELLLVGKKVRFEINVGATDKAGLTLSSELLKLAVTVRKAAR